MEDKTAECNAPSREQTNLRESKRPGDAEEKRASERRRERKEVEGLPCGGGEAWFMRRRGRRRGGWRAAMGEDLDCHLNHNPLVYLPLQGPAGAVELALVSHTDSQGQRARL
jgi:hypothetical protein